MSQKYILAGVNYGRNLDETIPSAPSFKYWEFVSSQLAVRNNIANIPNEQEWKNIEYLAKTMLQPLRDKIGSIDINSGFRCKKLNDLAGSSDTSHHSNGCAADLEPKEVSLIKCLEEASKLPYTEIIAEYFPNGWVHVATVSGRSDKKLKLKDDKHNFTPITLQELRGLYHG
jgi:hypothetical protein